MRTDRSGVLQPTLASRTRVASGVWVNDIHSQLNHTRVRDVVRIGSVEEIRRSVLEARRRGCAVSIAGGRHAMGGQQFGTNTLLLDMRGLNRVLRLDLARGTVEAQAGIEWPELIAHLIERQRGRREAWGIAQKQTGADRLTIGGALAANIHGRGLGMKPLVGDIESFTLIDAEGRDRRCSRDENPDLFRLAIGGYGLFGVVSSVTLRLTARKKVERVVEVGFGDDLMSRFEQRIADGFLFGDFQFAIDPASDAFLRRGVFSCYRPVDPRTPMPRRRKELTEDDWRRLLHLAHADSARAFEEYAAYYLTTSGQIYWSDTHQLSTYIDDYHRSLDAALGSRDRSTEMITEIYVPRTALAGFLDEARAAFRGNRVDLIYGTIRLIEKDDESFLAWAREPYACAIFNLHTVHTAQGIERSSEAFRDLIDMATRRGGSYYLTYHRYARRDQVLACYPQFLEFLRLKRQYDPQERFQSDWYRHHKQLLAREDPAGSVAFGRDSTRV